MWAQWRGRARLWHTVDDWVEQGAVNRVGVARVAAWCAPLPSPQAWQRFWADLCRALGVLFLASGTVLWVAANWSAFSRLERIVGLQFVLAVATIPALLPGVSHRMRSAALFLASVVLGALLALIGQQYQTGADSWSLFALWALLVVPWVSAAQSRSLWTLWIVLINAATILALRQCFDWGQLSSFVLLASVNLGLLGVVECVLPHLGVTKLTLLRRAVTGWLLAVLSVWVAFRLMDAAPFTAATGSALALWGAVSLLLTSVYRSLRPDLFALALVGLSAVGVAAVAIAMTYWHLVSQDRVVVLSLLVLLVPSLASLLAVGLRRAASRAPMRRA